MNRMKSYLAIITIITIIACGAIGGALLRAEQAGDKTTWSGVYSEAQAKRGETLYADKCASCHAPDLTGLDQAPPLSGDDFNINWNDLAVNDLFERIHISMPADKPGSLSRQEAADIVAFVLQKGGFPTGQAELPSEADGLKAIKFLAKKP
jgi:cytochrome c